MDFETLSTILQDQVKAAKDLAQSLGVPLEQLYYKWSKGEIQQVGKIDDERSYFFHGLDCSVKNQQTGEKIEICFAAHGRTDGFDEETLVMSQGNLDPDQHQKKLEEVRFFISEMLKQGKIRRSDENLTSELSMINALDKDAKQARLMQFSSENQMDMNIADRYIVTETSKN